MNIKHYIASALLVLLAVVSFAIPQTALAAAQEKVNIIYFWGDGCPNCERIAPWLDDYAKTNSDKVVLNKYEVWHNKENVKMFARTMKFYNIPDNEAGVPAIVVNNKLLMGTKEIAENLDKEVNAEFAIRNSAKNKDEKLNGLLSGFGSDKLECADGTNKREINIGAITMTALADSVNPCAMMVLVILLSSLMVRQKSKIKLALTAASFITAVFCTYFALGFGLSTLIANSCVSKWILTAVGGIALFIGLAELKDSFWYRKGNWAMEIPMSWRNKLNSTIEKATNPFGAFVAGVIVTLFELPCTGGPYLFGISLISMTDSYVTRFLLMGYYNLIFILPLIAITIAVLFGTTTIEKAESWRNQHVKAMHFITGVIMILMGIWVLFFR